MRFGLFLMGLFCAAVFVGSVTAQDEDEWGGLPPDEGRESVFYTCSACHSLAIVTQQGQSRDNWDELLVWMVEEQEMPEVEPAERSLILDYLTRWYGEDRKAKTDKISAGQSKTIKEN